MPTENELLTVIMGTMDPGRGAALGADAIAIWQTITRKFSPLLGASSTSLLFWRSLELNRTHFPWLPLSNQPGIADAGFGALQARMEHCAPPEVMAATRALLLTYIGLLTHLIGGRLTAQFLNAAFPGDGGHNNILETPK